MYDKQFENPETKKLAGKLIFFFWLILFTSVQVNGQNECDLKKAQDSIFVYTCKSPESKLKSLKATFTIKTSMAVLIAYVMNVPYYPKWQYNTTKSEVLKKIGDTELIYRSEIKAPWPVSGRDLVMHLKIIQDPVTKVLTILVNGLPGFVPENEDYVRVPKAEGKWVVVPLNTNELHVTYTLLIDPGGVVPVWLVNMAMADGPYQTFRNLKTLLESD